MFSFCSHLGYGHFDRQIQLGDPISVTIGSPQLSVLFDPFQNNFTRSGMSLNRTALMQRDRFRRADVEEAINQTCVRIQAAKACSDVQAA